MSENNQSSMPELEAAFENLQDVLKINKEPRPTEKGRAFAKSVAGTITGIGVHAVLKAVFEQYIDTSNASLVKKLSMKVGLGAIAGAVVLSVKKPIVSNIDEAFDALDEAIIKEQLKQQFLKAVAEATNEKEAEDA